MEYVPPSDPEDNDFDAETFDLYGLNEPTQVFTFEHHPRGDTYTNLQAFGQSEIGGDADPDNRAQTAETANDNAAHGPPSASRSSESVRCELEENVTAERPNSRPPASPQVAPAPEAHLQNSPGAASPQVVPRVVSPAPQTQRPNSPEYMLADSEDAPSSPPSPSSSISDAPDGPGSPNFPDAPPDISDEEESSPPPSPPQSSDEETDIDVDALDNDDDFGIPLQRPPSRPMINCHYDVDHELDYELGWEWIESDPGPMIAPYNGFRQCLIDPAKNKPEDFFRAIFDDRMFTLMADMTNIYAQNRIRSKYKKSMLQIISKFICKKCNRNTCNKMSKCNLNTLSKGEQNDELSC